MKKTLVALLLLASIGVSMPTFAAEPSLHEVYQAADAGKLDDAQRMMHAVLQAHPNSGKAHYVEAELLAKQGQLKQAANELASAEKFAPGLPFTDAKSVSSLKESINHHASNTVMPIQPVPAIQAPNESSFPWGMLGLGLAVMAFIAWASKFMANRNTQAAGGPVQPEFGGYRPAYPASPFGGTQQGYATPGATPAAGLGLGSQMLGGLATGAAVGAGVVAGEALMHHFMDGHKPSATTSQGFTSFDSIPDLPSTPLNDMGGNDFGISDSASWDDSTSTSDGDWN